VNKYILLILGSLFASPNGKHVLNPYYDGTAVGLGLITQILSNEQLKNQTGTPNQAYFVWDKNWQGQKEDWAVNASNTISAAALALPIIDYLAFKQGDFSSEEYLSHWVMLSQVLLWNSSLNLLSRSSSLWARPESFHGESPNKNKDALGSFYSGHASTAFAMASYWSWIHLKMNPNASNHILFTSSLYLVAASISVLRVVGGKHYPTDVLVGAVIGGFIGWFVPWLHWNEKQNLLKLQPIKNGIALRFAF
jgi:hypothetical protein